MCGCGCGMLLLERTEPAPRGGLLFTLFGTDLKLIARTNSNQELKLS